MKPEWAQFMRAAEEKYRAAEILDDMANRRRCDVRESNGHRCTADNDPGHEHRISEEDMP